MTLKETLLSKCHEFIDERHQRIQRTIDEIKVSLQSETKSSAGDKHETGRAMLQLEREKAGQQLGEVERIKRQLSKIDINKHSDVVSIGSAVITSQANYFLAISAGEIETKELSFYAISSSTPIGQLLLGKKVGEVVSFRDQNFTINRIL